MKLVEVVILTGVNCLSPVHNTPAKTEVTKVWCAVVVERDTEANRIRVTPSSEANNPEVKIVLRRMGSPEPSAQVTVTPPITSTAALPQPQTSPPVPETESPAERVETQPSEDPVTLEPAPQPKPAAADVGQLPQPDIETPASDEDPAAGETASDETALTPSAEAATEKKSEDKAEAKPEAKSKPKAKAKTATRKSTRTKTAKRSTVCSGSTTAVWYTNKEGRRKYRCRRGLY